MGTPEISVIMGVYNPDCEDWLNHAIHSIIQQSFENWELLICNDGCAPEQAEWLCRYPLQDSRIRILVNDKNLGLAASLNHCIAQAKGKYIARMDADDISVFCRFERQLQFLKEHPEYGFVSSDVILFDQKGVWGKRQMPRKPDRRDFLYYSPYVHPALMMRKETYETCRGYTEGSLTRRCEDYELFFRLAAAGIFGYNLPQALLYYRESRTGRKIAFSERWKEYQVRKKGLRGLGFSGSVSTLFSLRPLAAWLLPCPIRAVLKQRKTRESKRLDK